MPRKNYGHVKEINVGDATFTIWCDGRMYDPDKETYSPQYSYSIVTSKWRYDGNDMFGAPNKAPNVEAASVSILSLVLACASAEEDDENADLFPEHVREFGQEIFDQLSEVCSTLIEE